ncbi:hypothetical protein [Anianabacter salinae]|uniref:hypothetical protein n=1 Tax=Anianabacter salinae TaxID=2851023 RepID=UPI00225E6FC2|nr:hypothetical protein [Anianabacter salinae]MBV0911755.1 hypothetical protein [Anianabacter salinae]
MPERDHRPVARRRVFYIPGYDPIHPRRYRELYRKESAAQAAISGYEIALKPKTTGGRYGWHVEAKMDGTASAADVEVLVWSDIVRESMEAGIAATYGQLARTAWTYIATGTLFRLMRLRKGPVIAALYPVGMLILQLLLAVLAGWAAFALVSTAGHALADWTGADAGGLALVAARLGLGAACALLAGWGALRWFKAHDNRFFAYYLMHDYAFSARWGGANPPALEQRMTAFGDAIAAAMTSEVDEVLVVGHSSGAHLAVSILADLIRGGRVPREGPALAFLSLGQVVPMLSFLPRADRLRGDLHYLSASEALTWIDITAPGDGCAFALCDPVAVTGVAPQDQRWPLVISAAFTQTLAPETWARLRWRFFRLHFQYLCAFDRPGDYDYFRITAGAQTLAERYDGRMTSPSRITAAASRYTSIPT